MKRQRKIPKEMMQWKGRGGPRPGAGRPKGPITRVVVGRRVMQSVKLFLDEKFPSGASFERFIAGLAEYREWARALRELEKNAECEAECEIIIDSDRFGGRTRFSSLRDAEDTIRGIDSRFSGVTLSVISGGIVIDENGLAVGSVCAESNGSSAV